jgi:hypothetical protein
MKKVIVTTTINPPSKALMAFAKMPDWRMIVVGDKKTPHDAYRAIEDIIYLDPDTQQAKYPSLSSMLGWNTIQRRNIGFIEAYRMGCEIMATVDDDNYPYEDWGKNLIVGKTLDIDFFKTENISFDPFSVTNNSHLWHRGFPVELIKLRKNNKYCGKKKIKILVQSDLEDGDPDVDAICRIYESRPIVKFNNIEPFSSDKIAPFNSQNTFLHRECIPYYSMIHLEEKYDSRMDDIWGSFLLQHFLSEKMPFVAFTKPSVYQDRNDHNFVTDMEREITGYRLNSKLLSDISNYKKIIPRESIRCIDEYERSFRPNKI